MGPFVAFPSEIARNIKNTFKMTAIELGTDPYSPIKASIIPSQRRPWSDILPEGHPYRNLTPEQRVGLRRVGRQRLAGIVSTLFVLPQALQRGFRWLSGVKPEQQEALRDFMPPWSANSQVAILPGTDVEKGEYQYFDFSFMDPYNYVKKPFKQMLRSVAAGDENGIEAIFNTMAETTSPFTSPEIFWNEFYSLLTTWGKQKDIPWSIKSKEALYRMYRAFAPGTVITAERIIRAGEIGGVREVLPSVSKYGKRLKPFNELIAVVGPRVSAVNVPQAFQYKASEYASARRQASSIYTSEARNKGERSLYKLQQAKRDATVSNKEAGTRVLRYIEEARTLGMVDYKIIQELQSGGLSLENAQSLVYRGEIPPLAFE
jgi:hypothetical protein